MSAAMPPRMKPSDRAITAAAILFILGFSIWSAFAAENSTFENGAYQHAHF